MRSTVDHKIRGGFGAPLVAPAACGFASLPSAQTATPVQVRS
jgi:hypothetical protein